MAVSSLRGFKYLIVDFSQKFPYDYRERFRDFKATRTLTIHVQNTGKTKRYEMMERDGKLIIKVPPNAGCLGNLLQWVDKEYNKHDKKD